MIKRMFIAVFVALLIAVGYSISYGQDTSQSTAHLPIIMVDGNGSVEATVTVVILPPTDATNTPTPTLTATAEAIPNATSTPTPTPTNTETSVSTATATSLPSATLTPTPTLINLPTATPTPGKVVLVGSVIETSGYYGPTYVGEVENQTGHMVTNMQVAITGYDAVGKVIFVESSYTGLSSLYPGAKTCFTIYTYNGVTFPDKIGVVITWRNGSGNYLPLSTEGLAINFNVPGYPQVLGVLRNISLVDVTFPKAVVTIYDVSGSAIGCSTGYGVVQNLLSGKTTSFKVTFSESRIIGSYMVAGEAYR